MANEALESLQRNLIHILERDDDRITRRVKLQIIRIHDKAVVLQLNLKRFIEEKIFMEVANTAADIIDSLFSPENLSDSGFTEAPAVRLWEQLVELVAEVESTAGDVVDYILSSASHEDLTLPLALAVDISNRWGRLSEKIKRTGSDEDLSTELAVVDRYVNVPVGVGSSWPSAATTKDVVGFEGDLVSIMDLLLIPSDELRGHPTFLTQLGVLSIVGMAGIGKSTLAKIVYESPMIKHHFDICSWITISQDSREESVFLNLLASFKIEAQQLPTDRYGEIIYKHLHGWRYLIVLDNVWSTQLLDDIRSAFPDDYNGSRILLTTRLMDVADHRWNLIHVMRFLDEQRSWDLFQQEAFAGEACPLELQDAAKKIVLGCGGLPLSIVRVAGLISKTDKSPNLWQKIVANDGQLGTTSSSSYNHLPHHLRPCFLYMAAFPGDYEIHASDLIRLWIAEGFLELSERVGEAYLEDLVKKNLVMVITRKKIDGEIQICKLHSTVREFCVRQAEQEKLLLPVMDYLPTPILRRHFLPQVLENYRCISASWYDLDLKDSMQSPSTKTIICIPQKGYKPKGRVSNFWSLRVLHVLRRNDGSYWELGQVFDLIHLTYLASNIPTSIVPPAISNLKNLQTLIIYRHEVCLPVEIWRLRRLRHLIAFSFHPLPHPEEKAYPLMHLQTLSFATDFVCSAKMVRMIPNITKLGICYSETTDESYYCLDNISRFIQLEKLKLERRSMVWPSLNPHFPQSLERLTLSGWRLPWTDMAIVGLLPNLQVLKLRNYACDGERWETTEGGFRMLAILLIDESNLQHWITKSSHFPRLKWLMLHRCPSLHEIADGIGDIKFLHLIEIDDSNQSLLDSAKRIQEENQIDNWFRVHAVRL